jgi:hypothetical protein
LTDCHGFQTVGMKNEEGEAANINIDVFNRAKPNFKTASNSADSPSYLSLGVLSSTTTTATKGSNPISVWEDGENYWERYSTSSSSKLRNEPQPYGLYNIGPKTHLRSRSDSNKENTTDVIAEKNQTRQNFIPFDTDNTSNNVYPHDNSNANYNTGTSRSSEFSTSPIKRRRRMTVTDAPLGLTFVDTSEKKKTEKLKGTPGSLYDADGFLKP